MTWWRNLGGLVAACVLALLVVAPTVSMATCVCANDAPVLRVETAVAVVEAAQTDRRDHGAACDAACCASGHCHHGGTMVDTAVPGVPLLAPAASVHAMAAAHAPASRTLSGPDRPPRA